MRNFQHFKVSRFWLALFICVVNLLVMHYYILLTSHIETELDLTMFADNLLGVSFDVCIIFLVFYYLSWRRWKAALLLCFAVTWLWSFSNVMYSRFFFHYLTMSAIGQGGSLFDSEMIRCMLNGLRWSDLYFVLCVVLFSFLIKSVRNVKRIIAKFFVVLLIMVSVDICSYLVYCSLTPEYRYVSYLLRRMRDRQLSIHLHLCDPNNAAFRRGCVRTLSYELVLDYAGTVELTEEQRKLIAQEIEEVRESVSGDLNALSKKNVIFIIVESYMSFTSDKIVNGKEVTPFLNALKHDSLVYYNGTMHRPNAL